MTYWTRVGSSHTFALFGLTGINNDEITNYRLPITNYQKELVESPKPDREKLKENYSLLQSSSF